MFQNTTYSISEEIRPDIPKNTKNYFESFTLHSLHLILNMQQMPTCLNSEKNCESLILTAAE